jgi:hypothetical protein
MVPMNTAKSRLAILSNKTVKGAVRRICESLVEMADSIPDQNLSQIAIDKLSAYTSDVAVKSFVSNESRLLSLIDMGIKKSADRIISESGVSGYPHLKGPINQFKKLSESNPDYLIIENYLNNLRPLLWDPVVKSEYDILESKKNNLSEDILVKTSIDVIKSSRNAFIYGPLIEKLEAYVMDRTSGSRKMIIQELDRYKFDTNINKLANNLRLVENSFGGFNILANTTKCSVKSSVGFVDIKESADFILLDGNFYMKTSAPNNSSTVVPISESEIQKKSPSLYAINNIAKTKKMKIQEDNIIILMGRDIVKINENGSIYLNDSELSRDELKHKAAVSSVIDPSYSRGLTDVLTIHENVDKLMEIDFSKTISSNIYEGVKINVFRGNGYTVNYVNPSMNENKTVKFTSATQLKNFVWDTLSYDISESFVEVLSDENKEILKLQKISSDLFNKIVLIEKELKKIENEKANDEDIKESKMIVQLEESLQDELKTLKKRYNIISRKLNEASNSVPLPSVGDTVNVRSKGSGTVLSVDGVDRKFIVLLNSGETIQCIDKDLSIIETMVKKPKGSSPEADLQMIQGSNAKPSGKHSDVKKMVKESFNEDVDSFDDVVTVSIDDVKGMSTNPSRAVKHPDFGETYEEDIDSFEEMASKGHGDYYPEVDENEEESDTEKEHNEETEDVEESRIGYDFHDKDEIEDEYEGHGFYRSGLDDEEDFDPSFWEEDDNYDDEDDIIDVPHYPGDAFEKDSDDDIEGDEEIIEEDDEEDDLEDDVIEESDEEDDEEDVIDDDEDEVDEDIKSDELEMEIEDESDLHHYDRESRIHPGYGSKQVSIVDDGYELDGYPEEDDDLEIQFEEEEKDEDLSGSYGGAIDEA